jgi:hypothetical protein
MASPQTIEPTEPEGPQWPVQATDTIVRVVDGVRDKTTGPALNVVRYVIYGGVLALLALPLAVLALIGVFRAVEGVLLWLNENQTWAHWLHDPIGFVYLGFGVIFTLVAFYCWRKGKQPTPA